ncbi:MAG TPA: TRAM domain-containing protein [Fimbriimonadaceae bacterium]|nr:TRAM domain-containing protein [Fimbriimonadaceae bacterium]
MKVEDPPQTDSPPAKVTVSPSSGPRRLVGRFITVGVFAAGFAVLFAIGGPWLLNLIYLTVNHLKGGQRLWEPESPLTIIPQALLGSVVGLGAGNAFFRLCVRGGHRWERMDIADRVTLAISVFFGLFVSIPFLMIFNSMGVPPGWLALGACGVVLGSISLGIYVLQSMTEMLPWYKNRPASKRTGIKILDTNVIIDARIYDVARTGFLEGEIYVPNFVLEELQHIADHHDGLKRQRGRRGLDVLKHLQAEFHMEVGKYDRFAPDPNEEVDSRLVRIAKAIGADIVTNDWNLNNVAKLQNVKILSLNELALTLRPNVLPSESLELTIIREGNQPGQGVGYLDDGTMVVVENGKGHVGETLDVTVTQVIQTERGKMIFAEVDTEEEDEDGYSTRKPRRR